MADVEADVAVARQPPKKRTFKKFSLEASTWMPFLHAVSEPCRRSEKKTPLGHRSPASLTGIGVGHRYFAKNGVSVQPSDLPGQISVAAGNASSTFGPSEQRSKVKSETESVNPAGSIDVQKSSRQQACPNSLVSVTNARIGFLPVAFESPTVPSTSDFAVKFTSTFIVNYKQELGEEESHAILITGWGYLEDRIAFQFRNSHGTEWYYDGYDYL